MRVELTVEIWVDRVFGIQTIKAFERILKFFLQSLINEKFTKKYRMRLFMIFDVKLTTIHFSSPKLKLLGNSEITQR
jgi:hypothetical protein